MSATTALLRTEATLLARNPAAVIFTVLAPLAAAVVIASVPAARRPSEAFGGLSVAQAYTPSLVLFAVTMAALVAMPQILGGYREIGYLRRLRTTPVSPRQLLLALFGVIGAVTVVVSVVISVLPLIAGVPAPRHPWAFAAAIALAVVTFHALGAALSAVIPGTRIAAGVGNVVAMLMWFSAGLWFPRAQFPDWLRTVTDLTPGGAVAELMNTSSLGGTLSWAPVLVCLAWTAVATVVAVRTFRWE